MRLRDLEITLESISQIDQYDVSLEQYPTPAKIASTILFAAQMEYGDITGKIVCDLGCGNGIFALGAALLEATRVFGIDVQSKALKASQMNSRSLGIDNIVDWILGDVSSFHLRCRVDTVVSNPPFGVKKRGADLKFLQKAISIAEVTYSIHLAGEKNRIFLENAVEKLGARVTQIETFQFPIGKIYDYHKKSMHLIDVDLYRITTKR